MLSFNENFETAGRNLTLNTKYADGKKSVIYKSRCFNQQTIVLQDTKKKLQDCSVLNFRHLAEAIEYSAFFLSLMAVLTAYAFRIAWL